MERSAIIEKVCAIMEDVFDLDDLEYNDALSAVDFEEWDSLSNIRFMVAIEKEFSVRFSNSEIEGLQSVGEMVDLLSSKLA